MNRIDVRPVRSRRDRKIFLTFPWRIFQGDPLWVPPLLPDWRQRIDPARGVFFQRGVAEFFIAWCGSQPVGTICAAEDQQANLERRRRDCVFGFFNFIRDYQVMQCLLSQAADWAASRGLDSITGPFNLDYEDSYGILVEGRDRPPPLMCGHTPPYYYEFMERYGFQPARGDNIAYAVDISEDKPVFREVGRMAAVVRARGRFSIRPADLDHWKDELDRIHILLNRSLAHLPDHRDWPREVVYHSLAPFRKIADPELILFAQEGDRTVGWLPGIPNLNEAFIHVNGLRYPWNYLALWRRLRRRARCLTIKSILSPPEYWGSGLVILLFDEMIKRARARGYQWIDCSLTSTDNPRTPALAERMGGIIYKRYRVYRKAI